MQLSGIRLSLRPSEHGLQQQTLLLCAWRLGDIDRSQRPPGTAAARHAAAGCG